MQIFASEEVELPRQSVADFLQNLDPAVCARYVEYLIDEKAEVSPTFHNRLVELYLRMAMSAKKRGDNGKRVSIALPVLHRLNTAENQILDSL